MRKEQKLVVGFVATLAGVAGALHVYLPFYSKLGQEAHQRAGRRKADPGSTSDSDAVAPAGPSASMWKNMDKRSRE